MWCLEQSLPVIIYILLIILIVVLIAFIVKAYYMLNKVDKVIDHVKERLNSLENLFSMIDNVTDSFASMSNKIVGMLTMGVSKLFKKKEDDKNE